MIREQNENINKEKIQRRIPTKFGAEEYNNCQTISFKGFSTSLTKRKKEPVNSKIGHLQLPSQKSKKKKTNEEQGKLKRQMQGTPSRETVYIL